MTNIKVNIVERMNQLSDLQLYGEIMLTVYEENEIIKDARIILSKGKRHFSAVECYTVYFALLTITKKWDGNESNFWKYIVGVMDISQKDLPIIYEYVKCFYRLRNKDIFVTESGKNTYYSTILAESLSTKHTFYSLISLLFDVFKESLLFDYVKNDSVFRSIANALESRFLGSNEDDLLHVGEKAYILKSPVRYLVTQDKGRFLNLVDQIMSYFDSSKNIQSNSYLYEVLDSWTSMHQQDIKERVRTIDRSGAVSITKLQPKYKLENNKLFLVTPNIRLEHYEAKSKYEFFLISSNGSKRLFDCVTFGNELIKNIRERFFEVPVSFLVENEPLNLCLKILSNGKEIYSSKDTLNRDLILFRNDIEVLGKQVEERDYVCFTTFIKQIENYSGVNYISKFIYSVYISHINSLSLGSTLIYSGSEVSSVILPVKIWYGVTTCEEFRYLNNDDVNEIEVVSSINSIKFWVENPSRWPQLILSIKNNDVHKKFRVNAPSNYEHQDLNVIISDIFDLNPGKVKIQILNSASNIRLHSKEFYYYPNLEYNTSNPVFYKKDDYIEFSQAKYYVDFNKDSIDIELDEGLLRFTYRKFCWYLNSDLYNTPLSEPIWHEEINSNNILNITSDNFELGYTHLEIDGQVVKMNKHFLSLEKILSSSSNLDLTTVKVINTEKNIHIPLFNISKEEKFNGIPIIRYVQNHFYFNAENNYTGDPRVLFKIVLSKDNIEKYSIEGSLKFEKEVMIEDDQYDISVYRLSTNVFAKNVVLLKEFNMIIGDYWKMRFRDNRIVLKKVIFNDFQEKGKLEKHYLEGFQKIDGQSLNATSYLAEVVTAKRKDIVLVEVFNKANLVLSKYNPKSGMTKPIGYDSRSKSLTDKSVDKKNVYDIDVIYYEVEKNV